MTDSIGKQIAKNQSERINCKSCNTSCIYDMKCEHCRHDLLMDEPCKLIRKYLAESIEKYGKVAEWRIEPHCGCGGNICKRLQNMRLAKANA